MGNRKERKRRESAQARQQEPSPVKPASEPAAPAPSPEPAPPPASAPAPEANAHPRAFQALPRRSFLRRWGSDIAKAAVALAILVVAVVIWFQPPLIRARFPRLTYIFQNRPFDDAELYRPLAMPTRYYIKLPHELARRYQWFAVDRRREIAALAAPPSRSFFGKPAIRRSDSLGLDLEFTKLDNSEWRVAFNPDSIVFSNAVLSVRLDAGKQAAQGAPAK